MVYKDSSKTELDFIKKIPIKYMIGRFHAKELIDSVELKDKFKNGELLMHDINENNGIFEIISFDKDFDNKDQIIRIFCH